MMANPFNYTSELVPGTDHLIGREREMKDLTGALKENIPSLLLGRRNIGKSSLMRFVAYEARSKGQYVITMDCSFISSIGMLQKELIRQLKAEGLWEELQVYLKRLDPPSVEKSTNIGLNKILNASSRTTKKKTNYEGTHTQTDEFINILRALDMVTSDTQRQLLFLFDEVQTWSKIASSEHVSAANVINAVFKENSLVNYFFSGSQQRLIEEMFLDRNESNFWNSINTLEIEVPPLKSLSKFIKQVFQDTDKDILPAAIDSLLATAGLNTEAIQELAFYTWEKTKVGEQATIATVNLAIDTVLSKHHSTYRRTVSQINTNGTARDEVFLGLAKMPTEKTSSPRWLISAGLDGIITREEMRKSIIELLDRGEIVLLKNGLHTPSDPFLHSGFISNYFPKDAVYTMKNFRYYLVIMPVLCHNS